MARLNRTLIADIDVFQGLEDADLDTVLEHAGALRVEKDAAVFEQGAEASRFFLLLDGALRVVQTTRDGQQVIARYIAAGSLVGIAPAIGRDTYPATAVAAVDCVLISWPMSIWPELTARFPVFAANAYRTVGMRLQETQDRVVELSLAQVEQRVANAVLRLVRQTGRKTEDGIEIDFPVSRQDIADMTGTTLHTVSRLMSSWEGQGMIRSGRKRISVTDPHRLMMVSQGKKDS